MMLSQTKSLTTWLSRTHIFKTMHLFNTLHLSKTRPLYKGCIALCTVFLLFGCQGIPGATPAAPTATPAPSSPAEQPVTSAEPLSLDKALPPTLFQLPELDIEFRVSPMGWTVVDANGSRTTRWIVPQDAAGWHINSAGAGAAGNTILSGQQTAGEAVFAPLSLGEIQPGQQIFLTSEDGQVYVYEVKEVSQPIPMIGATPADEEAAAAFVAPSSDAKLTLITGWPDFATTHRVFAVAQFLGIAQTP